METVIFGKEFKARLQMIQSNAQAVYNWVFLPGGPGLGSESLSLLTQKLRLPGCIWHLDMPGDGSNLTSDDDYYFEHWPDALIEALENLSNVILVAHSTGGMYALANPKLEPLLQGLVLMDSAPDASWQEGFMEYVKHNPLPDVVRLEKMYAAEKTNEHLEELTIASIAYLVHGPVSNEDISFFEQLPYNVKACDWSAHHFDQTYKSKWVPTIPTLIFAGEYDHITPIALFQNNQAFNRSNILIRTIPNAGHYPWIENSNAVQLLFAEYLNFC
jgi:pimeloyl-ACP methyl ester carboxylesterase